MKDMIDTMRAIAAMDDREVAEQDAGSYARDLARQALSLHEALTDPGSRLGLEDPRAVLAAVWEHWQGGDVPPELERRIRAVLG